ncbi:hypothetical protein [Nocardia sp. FDAARGOS_372]|uniref:hypothetical protein n=1 Tax=Nocardia sp. FDAARGOS_372 TaxID=2018066 RepID=UPI0015626CAF|nr:hypothetical protein [Nocardia sp. FDAARGOS_372]
MGHAHQRDQALRVRLDPADHLAVHGDLRGCHALHEYTHGNDHPIAAAGRSAPIVVPWKVKSGKVFDVTRLSCVTGVP